MERQNGLTEFCFRLLSIYHGPNAEAVIGESR